MFVVVLFGVLLFVWVDCLRLIMLYSFVIYVFVSYLFISLFIVF